MENIAFWKQTVTISEIAASRPPLPKLKNTRQVSVSYYWMQPL